MKKIENIKSLYELSKEVFGRVREYEVDLIINAQDFDGNTNLKFEYANKIERFTRQEYKEIISAIDELEVRHKIYHNELEFIDSVIHGNRRLDNIIVFNFARNGLKEGKKSLIPTFCSLLNVKYTGSNAFVQSLCRNKYVYNKFLNYLGIDGPKTYAITPRYNWIAGECPTDVQNVIVKPIAESGSIGVSNTVSDVKCLNLNEIEFVNGQAMLLQEFIDGREIECPFFVYDEEVIYLAPVELKLNCEKYLNTEISVNNNYSFEIYEGIGSEKLEAIVKKTVSALNIKGYGRLDFRITETGDIYLFDVATMPFICEHSSFSFAMKYLGYKRSDIFKIILCITELENTR